MTVIVGHWKCDGIGEWGLRAPPRSADRKEMTEKIPFKHSKGEVTWKRNHNHWNQRNRLLLRGHAYRPRNRLNLQSLQKGHRRLSRPQTTQTTETDEANLEKEVPSSHSSTVWTVVAFCVGG
jgi:hypothetical protein